MAQPLAPPSPPVTTSSTHTTGHKKHNRHHVKRRSSGRVHVTKLAPMARANSSHTDTEADEHDGKRPHMRRSQSQRSLNRLSSFERKGGGLTALASIHPPKTNTATTTTITTTTNTTIHTSNDVVRADVTTTSPPTTPSPPSSATGKDEDGDRDEGEAMITRKEPKEEPRPPPRTRKDSPGFFVSSRAPAAPIEQTLTAVAKNLVGSDREATTPLHNNTTITTSTTSHNNNNANANKRAQPLRSQFVDDATDPPHRQQQQQAPTPTSSGGTSNNNRRLSNVAAAANAQPPGMTRTQQKLMLQRQHCLVDDENNLAHPRNMLRLTREIERVGKEYRCVRQYHDPMAESLQRCLEQQQQQQQQEPVRLQQRTRSSSVIPTSVSLELHAGQRQAIHRRHIQLKLMAETGNQHGLGLLNSAQTTSTSSTLDMIRWSAGALIDRVWNGTGIN